MSAQAGRSMSVKIKNDAGEFIPLVGLRTRALKFNSETVNITHPDSIEVAGIATRCRCKNHRYCWFWRLCQ